MRRLVHLFLLLAVSTPIARADLGDYVSRPDATYAWSPLYEKTEKGIRFTELRMTSQTWQGIPWRHKLVVLRPEGTQADGPAVLIIGGGSWKKGDETRRTDVGAGDLQHGAAIAKATKMPVAVLSQVPFQPMFDDLHEDELIALSFKKYMETGDTEWPLLLPMVKAAVRAMDTVQAFAKDKWGTAPPSFVVCGASKRGWTTWLTAVADPRVKGIAPLVFDTLRMPEQMKHQLATWGRYSEQIGDYTEIRLPEQLDTPHGRELMAMVDPYAYRRLLTMPKLLVMGTNDRYWTLDALNLYWDELRGEKHLVYVPNVRHNLKEPQRVVDGVSALAMRVAGRLRFPVLSWEFARLSDSLRLTVRSDVRPARVLAWTARSKSRDFREARWHSNPIKWTGRDDGYTLPVPTEGFAAMFAEAVYEIDGHPLSLSTQIRIVPEMPASQPQ